MEKTGEALTYLQGGTNVTRMDYLSPLNNELVFSMATERLLGIAGGVEASWQIVDRLHVGGRLLARWAGGSAGRGSPRVSP